MHVFPCVVPSICFLAAGLWLVSKLALAVCLLCFCTYLTCFLQNPKLYWYKSSQKNFLKRFHLIYMGFQCAQFSICHTPFSSLQQRRRFGFIICIGGRLWLGRLKLCFVKSHALQSALMCYVSCLPQCVSKPGRYGIMINIFVLTMALKQRMSTKFLRR